MRLLKFIICCTWLVFLSSNQVWAESVQSETQEAILSSEPLVRDGDWYANEVSQLARNNPIGAIEIAREAEKYFISHSDFPSEAIVLNESSTALYFLARFPEAMQKAKSAEKFAEKHDLKESLARSYTRQGNVLQSLGEHQRTVELYNKALAFYRAEGMNKLYGQVLNNIANVYLSAGQYDSALNFYYQYQEIAITSYERASVALGVANVFDGLDKVKEAQDNFQSAIDLFAESDDKIGWELANAGMGAQLLESNQPLKAIEFLDEAIISAADGKRIFRKVGMLTTKSLALNMLNRHQEALDISNTAEALAIEIDDKFNQILVYETQLDIYQKLGLFREALDVSNKAKLIKSQFVNEEVATKLAVMQVLLEVETKDFQIELLRSKNEVQQLEIKQQRILTFSMIGLLFFAILAFVFFWYRKNQLRLMAEQKMLNAQLEKINQLKDQLLTNTSHELRTPLNGIIGMTQLLLDEVEGLDHDLRDNVKIIDQCGRRLLHLIEDILDLSQLQAHRLKIDKKAFELKPIVVEVCQLLENMASKKGLTIGYDIQPDDVKVFADQKRLHQVLNNLIGNAIKFSTHGKILISTIQFEDQIEISIKDQGEGISEDSLELIFEPFTQIDASNQRINEGTGLGLPITKELLALHGSELKVRSTKNQGSEFWFSLPIAS